MKGSSRDLARLGNFPPRKKYLFECLNEDIYSQAQPEGHLSVKIYLHVVFFIFANIIPHSPLSILNRA